MKICLDTCVWLNFLQNEKTSPVLLILKKAIDTYNLLLIVPEQVYVEVDRHKDNILKSKKDAIRTYRSHASELKSLLSPESAVTLTDILKEVDNNSDKYDLSLDKTYNLLQQTIYHPQTIRLETTNHSKVKAADRGLKKVRPFHKGAKNSMADAVIIESLLAYQAKAPSISLYFVTVNSDDFSDAKNKLEAHPDFNEDFEKANIKYSILPGDVIEELANTPIPDDVKKSFKRFYFDLGGILQAWMDEVTECLKCGGELAFNGHLILKGCSGEIYVCKQCGTTHHLPDDMT